jgi:non-homologous end joining protein Ku
MATSVWKGHISFGLVSFPVKLHAAARSQAVSFNQLHQCDHSRVKQVLYCQAEDKPVSRSELVKGFEYEKDRYVVVEERELDQMAPRSSRVMEVLEFVPEAEVDPPNRVPAPVADILEALKASLERLKKPVVGAQQPPQPAPAPKRTRKALAAVGVDGTARAAGPSGLRQQSGASPFP